MAIQPFPAASLHLIELTQRVESTITSQESYIFRENHRNRKQPIKFVSILPAALLAEPLLLSPDHHNRGFGVGIADPMAAVVILAIFEVRIAAVDQTCLILGAMEDTSPFGGSMGGGARFFVVGTYGIRETWRGRRGLFGFPESGFFPRKFSQTPIHKQLRLVPCFCSPQLNIPLSLQRVISLFGLKKEQNREEEEEEDREWLDKINGSLS